MGYYMNMEQCSFFVAKENADSVDDLLDEEGFCPTADKAGNIIDLEWCGEKLRDQYTTLCNIAMFVSAGSYIEMSGEDGARWRWYFTGSECEEHDAEIVWPSMEGYLVGAPGLDGGTDG